MREGVVAVDLDGVILEFEWDKWAKFGMDYFGKPKEGAKKALKKLQIMGFKILIYTCRTNPRMHPDYSLIELHTKVAEILQHFKIPYDEIWVEQGKPIADYYIDDRAVYFSDWEKVLNGIALLEGFTGGKK